MIRKRRPWFLALLILLTVLCTWRLTRRKIPIEFIGKAPRFTFYFEDEFSGEPLINLELPGGRKLQFPTKYKLVRWKANGPVAGYLHLDDIADKDHLVGGFLVDGSTNRFDAVYLDDRRSTPPAVSSRTLHPGKPLIEVPFATSEKYRDAVLTIQNCRVRLPLANGVGASHRKATVLKAGNLELSLNPEPWRLTTAPLIYKAIAKAPPKEVYVIDISWLQQHWIGLVGIELLPPFEVSQARDAVERERLAEEVRRMVAMDHDRIFMNNGVLQIESALPHQKFTAEISRLLPTRTTVRVRRKSLDNVELFLPNGTQIYGDGRGRNLKKLGFAMLGIGGKYVLANDHEFFCDNRLLMSAKDGAQLEVMVYRSAKSWTLTDSFDTPSTFKDTGLREGGSYSLP